jgi:hypothetical protein
LEVKRLIDSWIGVLKAPEETMAAEKAKASIMGGIVNFVIASLIIGIPVGVILALASFLLSAVPGLGGMFGALGVLAIVLVPIATIIFVVVGSLILNLILWIAAKIVGGSGSYGTQYYLLSIIAVPVLVAYLVAYIVLFVLMLIPIIGVIIGMLIMGLIMGYIAIISIMSYVSALKEAHGFTTAQVAMATGVCYAVAMIVVIIIAMIIGAALFTAMGPMIPGGTGFPGM